MLLLVACSYPAEFGSPLSEPGATAYDERLLGTWFIVGGDRDEAVAGTLTAAEGEDGLLDVTGVFFDSKARRGSGRNGQSRGFELETVWIRWAAHASALDGETYFNARILDYGAQSQEAGHPTETVRDEHFVPHPDRGYWIARAEIGEDGLLRLDLLWEDGLEGQGLPTRKVTCGADCGFEIVDLSPEELASLIRAAEPGSLFTLSFVLARVDGIHPPQPGE
jgi:hypothetical protein